MKETSKVNRFPAGGKNPRLEIAAASGRLLSEGRLPNHPFDALSRVLDLVRLRGDTVALGEIGISAKLTFPAGSASFVHLRHGNAVICQTGLDPLPLRAGDFALFLHSEGYSISDAYGEEVRCCCEARVTSRRPREAKSGRRADESKVVGRFVAGTFSFDVGPTRSLLRGLPRVIHLKHGNDCVHRLSAISGFLIEEMANSGPGASMITSRLIDLLVTCMLRIWIGGDSSRLASFLGLSDERIERALSAIHLKPAHAWTVESLAELAAMSRSVFSDHFTAIVGLPPLRYLTKLRLTIAADLLQTGTMKVVDVALNVGYGSEASFSRAFKAQYGYPPGVSRRIAKTELFPERS